MGCHTKIVSAIQVDNWIATLGLGDGLWNYLFRGHASAGWRLSTTLERASMRWAAPLQFLTSSEDWVLRQFQRRAQHYLTDPPEPDSHLEWLALIQHYGGLTRLLDVTRSFMVGLFFAIEAAEGDAAVWCFKRDNLIGALPKELHPIKTQHKWLDVNDALVKKANEVISGRIHTVGVIPVEPFRMNQRLAAQQGGFLFPLSGQETFLHNLNATLGLTPNDDDPAEGITPTTFDPVTGSGFPDTPVVKIIIPQSLHSEFINKLEHANISAVTLFEDLSGFARSLTGSLRVWDRLRQTGLTFDP